LLTYATSFLPTVGARVFYRRLAGPGSSVDAAVRTAGPSVILTELALATPADVGLTGNVSWNRRHDRLFAGIGPNSQDDLAAMGQGQARFASDALRGELRWSRALPRRFGLSLHTDGQKRDYSNDDVRGGVSVAGLLERARRAAKARRPATPASIPCWSRASRTACASRTAAPAWRGTDAATIATAAA
jgi:hypothetical protein